MPRLNEQQIEERGQMLQGMADDYWQAHQWMERDEAYHEFATQLLNDPVKMRAINALASLG